MQNSTERAEHRQTDKATQPSTKPVPRIIRSISSDFGLRHVKGVAITRALASVWLAILGSFFCAHGHWWGASLVVTAGLVGWLAYQMPRWKPALEAENALRVPR